MQKDARGRREALEMQRIVMGMGMEGIDSQLPSLGAVVGKGSPIEQPGEGSVAKSCGLIWSHRILAPAGGALAVTREAPPPQSFNFQGWACGQSSVQEPQDWGHGSAPPLGTCLQVWPYSRVRDLGQWEAGK